MSVLRVATATVHADTEYHLRSAGREALSALDDAEKTLASILATSRWGARGLRALAAELELARALILRDRQLTEEAMSRV